MEREEKPNAPVLAVSEKAQAKQECCIIIKKGDEINLDATKIVARKSTDDD